MTMPAPGGPATTLFRVAERQPLAAFYGWSVNARGTFAIAIPVALDASRIAIVDLASGSVRWLNSPAPGTTQLAPIWSADGASVLYGQTNIVQGGGTIEEVRLDGTTLKTIRPTGVLGGALLPALDTAEGVLLYTEEFNGSQLFAFDRRSGRTTALGARAELQSRLGGWRSTAPRVVAQAITNIAGPGSGGIVLWDDVSGKTTTLTSGTVAAPSFDPTGRRIVYGAYDTTRTAWHLEIIATDGTGRTALPDTENARGAVWTAEGIYFSTAQDSPHDLRVIDPAAQTARTLFHTDDILASHRMLGG